MAASPTSTFSGAWALISSFGSRTWIFIAAEPVKVTQAWQLMSPLVAWAMRILIAFSWRERSVPKSHIITPSTPSALGSVEPIFTTDGTRT